MSGSEPEWEPPSPQDRRRDGCFWVVILVIAAAGFAAHLGQSA